ncbi:DUF1523 family protein [uncultured Paracoccus sp.]|uniref:DUF1523 family protein n=1 Tax=uncultured Paracoccus sp. TaxID=189685 RepID=UPI00262BC13F|nr:DUF1523 family protein [uncultured Paracoccus sp.]
MRVVQVTTGVVFGVLVFLFLDYALPSRNTVRITNVYNQITDLGPNAIFYASPRTGTVETSDGRRDVRYIAAVRPGGKPFVYRNEDTGWIWPPYFKYDSSNLHAVASDQVSTAANPKWVSITAYGWRIPWWTIFPNAISIDPVAGPNDRPLNWLAMLILGLMGAALLAIWRMWNRFRGRHAPRRVVQVRHDPSSATTVRQVAPMRPAGGRVRRWWDGLRGR